MIYEYSGPYLSGPVNRKRVRGFYDPDVEFISHSYHPKWGIRNRQFIVINFSNNNKRILFEIEFSRAELIEMNSLPNPEILKLNE